MIQRNSFILFFFLSVARLQAQDTSGVVFNKPDKNYFISYFKTTKDIFSAPSKWKGREVVVFSGVIAADIVLISNDVEIQNMFQRNRSSFSDNAAKYGLEPWGRGLYSMPAMGLLFAYGSITKNDQHKEAALLGVKSFVLSGLLVNIPKYIFQRQCPFENTPPENGFFEGPFGSYDHTSHPSGHTCTAFAVATTIARYYRKPWLSVTVYSLAALTGLSRINDNRHWASDVFLGGTLGYAIGSLVVTFPSGSNRRRE